MICLVSETNLLNEIKNAETSYLSFITEVKMNCKNLFNLVLQKGWKMIFVADQLS